MMIFGLHLFAVANVSNVEGDRIKSPPGANHMVISISRNYEFTDDVKQWCPPLTADDKKEIFDYLNVKGPKRGHGVHFYAMDLGRILNTRGLLRDLVEIEECEDTPRLPFECWQSYPMTERLLALSKHIAQNAAHGLPWVEHTTWANHGGDPQISN